MGLFAPRIGHSQGGRGAPGNVQACMLDKLSHIDYEGSVCAVRSRLKNGPRQSRKAEPGYFS